MTTITVKSGSVQIDDVTVPLEEILSFAKLNYYPTEKDYKVYWQQHVDWCRRISGVDEEANQGFPIYTKKLSLHASHLGVDEKVWAHEEMKDMIDRLNRALPKGALAHYREEHGRRGSHFELRLSCTDEHLLRYEL